MSKKLSFKEIDSVRYYDNGTWIDFSKLPRIKNGKAIDWSNSIGLHILYNYENKEGCAEIENYIKKGQLLSLKLQDGRIAEIKTPTLLGGLIGNLIKNYREHKYKVGEIVNGLEILNQIKMKHTSRNFLVKAYTVKCIVDGYIYDVYELNLDMGNGCRVCRGDIVVSGINDVATTHPHLVKYFVNPEDATKYSQGSRHKCLMRCPDCGFEKWMAIADLVRYRFSCNRCSDGISYPNKFITSLISQLNIIFELEKQFDWSDKRKYDIYIPYLNMIIENHGKQHYDKNNTFENCGGKSFEEEQKNDNYKKELALNNGIRHYIELDCRESVFKWIKDNIMKSELPKLLNFNENDINWTECEIYASKSLLVEACDLWNKGTTNSHTIAEMLNIAPSTSQKYLKTGSEIGICSYDLEEVEEIRRKKVSEFMKKRFSKKIYMYDLDMKFIGEFESGNELARQSEKLFGIKLNQEGISKCCRSDSKHYKNYIFSYIKILNKGEIDNDKQQTT